MVGEKCDVEILLASAFQTSEIKDAMELLRTEVERKEESEREEERERWRLERGRGTWPR